MFGLERDTEQVDFSYDLENDLKDPTKGKKIKEETESIINEIKTTLRKGEDKELYDKLGTVLHGYISLKKVIERCTSTT